MLQLSLRHTTFDDGPRQDDCQVIWTSDEYGARRVGLIRLASEHAQAERREWAINPPMPIPAWCHGMARSRPMATAAFRRVFEKFIARRPRGNGRTPSPRSTSARRGLRATSVADLFFGCPLPRTTIAMPAWRAGTRVHVPAARIIREVWIILIDDGHWRRLGGRPRATGGGTRIGR